MNNEILTDLCILFISLSDYNYLKAERNASNNTTILMLTTIFIV